MCNNWITSYETFLHDMGRRPGPNYSIARRDVDGQYSPENCYWATGTQQARNTRVNTRIQFRGETRCLAEWSEITGISGPVITNRLHAGWGVDRSLTQPVRKGKSEIAEEVRLRRSGIESRLWRNAVQHRDQYTCQRCKVVRFSRRRTGLATHHILNFADWKELRYSPENGITLCTPCHLVFHVRYGRKHNTPEQLEEFLHG